MLAKNAPGARPSKRPVLKTAVAWGPLLFTLTLGCVRPPAPPALAPEAAPDAPPAASEARKAEPAAEAKRAPPRPDDYVVSLVDGIEPAALTVVRNSPVVAAGRLSMLFSECSGMGGLHTIFDVVPLAGQPGLQLAHGGGHGAYGLPGLSPQNSMMMAGGKRIAGERWYVLGLRATPRLDEDHDSNPDSSRGGWCLNGMPGTDAVVLGSIPMPTRDAAEKLAQAIKLLRSAP